MMMSKPNVFKVLWIEDDALFDLNGLAAAVHTSLKYKLVIARNVTEAVDSILKNEYDVIIVDVRLPPGGDERWARLFINARAEVEQNLGNKLGLQLLYTLLAQGDDRVIRVAIPDWVSPDRFAVFTVEEYTTIERHLSSLGVKFHVKKKAGLPRRTLRDLIDQVLQSRTANITNGGGSNGNGSTGGNGGTPPPN